MEDKIDNFAGNDSSIRIKENMQKFIPFNAPENGEIKLRIKLKTQINKSITFICFLNEFYEPNFHISINCDNKIWFSRHSSHIGWVDVSSQTSIVPNRLLNVQIFYGEFGDRIFIDDQEETIIKLEYVGFPNSFSSFISFGDLRNSLTLPSDGLIYIEDFKISKIDHKGNSNSNDIMIIDRPRLIISKNNIFQLLTTEGREIVPKSSDLEQ